MDEFLIAASNYYGAKHQSMMFMEEASELIKELSKNIRGANNVDKIAEEIADVEIMLEQLTYLFGCINDVTLYKAYKTDRLWKRMQEEMNDLDSDNGR